MPHLKALYEAIRAYEGPEDPIFQLVKLRSLDNEQRVLVKGEKIMAINKKKEARKILDAKKRELMSGTSDREEILIENAAEDFDRLQQQLNREVAIRNLDRESKLLKEVQAAINRVEEGTYGTCLRCEEEIPEKRMKAVPWAAYCIGCQETIERQRAAGEEVEEEADAFERAAA